MKIGIIAPYDVLSTAEGASIRVYQLAKSLSCNGATVCVLHHGVSKQCCQNLSFKHFKFYNLLPGISNYIHPLNYFYLQQLINFVKGTHPDILQCEGPWSMFPTLLVARKFNIPCILDEHNVEFFWSLYASKVPLMAPSVFALEKIATSSSSLIISTSDIDKEAITKLYNVPQEKIVIVPNGVNTETFNLSLTKLQLRKKLGFGYHSKLVLFHGLMSAKQNYEAAALIIDSIAPEIAEASFLIIGKGAPKWLKKKADAQSNVSLLGYVPNIEEYVKVADVCIAPIQRGSGTRLKVLEYLAAGKPIVATFDAVEGLPLLNGVHGVFYKKVDRDYINSVIQLLNSQQLCEDLSRTSKEFASAYDWSQIGHELWTLYSGLF